MRQSLLRWIGMSLTAVALTLPLSAQASVVEEKPTALAMTGDAIFARPALFAVTVVGTAVYVVSLPFSLVGNNAEEAADMLVVGPAKATFVRCLGCTRTGRKEEVVTVSQ
ncbi:MAG: hypothetical protein IPM37_10455 [Hahellaceae bacterium]|jgi:hypothetical protein|nr:hypothetical protein [Hahellaceae bacterium]